MSYLKVWGLSPMLGCAVSFVLSRTSCAIFGVFPMNCSSFKYKYLEVKQNLWKTVENSKRCKIF